MGVLLSLATILALLASIEASPTPPHLVKTVSITATKRCTRDACYTAIGGSLSRSCPATSTSTTTSSSTETTVATVLSTSTFTNVDSFTQTSTVFTLQSTTVTSTTTQSSFVAVPTTSLSITSISTGPVVTDQRKFFTRALGVVRARDVTWTSCTTITSAVVGTPCSTTTPTCPNSAAISSACNCRSIGGISMSTVQTVTTTTSTTTSVQQRSFRTSTVIVVPTTSTIVSTTTTALTQTAIATGTQFNLRVVAGANSPYNGRRLMAYLNDDAGRAAISLQPSGPFTLFSVVVPSARLIISDGTASQFNGFIANSVASGNPYKAVLFDDATNGKHPLQCVLTSSQTVICASDSGEMYFEACGGLLEITRNPGGDNTDPDVYCEIVTLMAVAPS